MRQTADCGTQARAERALVAGGACVREERQIGRLPIIIIVIHGRASALQSRTQTAQTAHNSPHTSRTQTALELHTSRPTALTARANNAIALRHHHCTTALHRCSGTGAQRAASSANWHLSTPDDPSLRVYSASPETLLVSPNKQQQQQVHNHHSPFPSANDRPCLFGPAPLHWAAPA